ncbi:MAG: hypothetical protein ABH885_03110, partial [Candidatus Omnitrophota bacterium]
MIKLKFMPVDLKKALSGPYLGIIIAAVFGLIILTSVMFGSVYYSGNIKEGDISLRTLYAPYDFRYPWGVNEEKTQEAKDRIRKRVPIFFTID